MPQQVKAKDFTMFAKAKLFSWAFAQCRLGMSLGRTAQLSFSMRDDGDAGPFLAAPAAEFASLLSSRKTAVGIHFKVP